MREIVQRMVWFTIVASAIAYATYLVAGSIVSAQASRTHAPIIIRDELGGGVHRLSGMVMVPTPCHELILRTEEVSKSDYALLFKTWREPSTVCEAEEVPRHFRAMLFAPASGVDFTATLDGKGFPIVVMPVTPGE
ncbi:hypothetical protein A2763_02610 [Candidatus Kaiserbacteria bacterium RIFCSPHIGHO2_01_FULL_54_36]|uniref:Uncharacterized protein n=1 Tax=Candidatus Kaiserbacteria bacterium RIFCSPHIGHO2_01_FULL_54_36 TaxID=1798482 RepID=A0A1F6CNL0_9BACT|nr:MAG: hypothetical protein A2763_02610 [Candidatus Kaiserbacteria bacterium RIFCSPHIGHO2_01_FULL_54_36]OGG75523.1 MAG: hypothetical protein A3A41_00460 [Candidatus Kaiserbacteria bacterium RIFCSPLOWO2_01_FULL_54_22]